MTQATVQTITELMVERANKVAPILRQLQTVIRDEDTPAERRQQRERELRTQMELVNEKYERLINAAVEEAKREPERAMVEGSGLSAAELAEAAMVADEYRPLSDPERNGLVREIEADLRAGRTSGARIKARAAQTLRIPIGPLAGQLIEADPAKVQARDAHLAILALHEAAGMEPVRERLAAGLGSAAESVRVKEFAASRQLRRDVSFTAQVQPGYSGPTIRSGAQSPWPEPHNPELEKQRELVERAGRGDMFAVEDAAARYNEPPGGGTRQLTSHRPVWATEAPAGDTEPAEAPEPASSRSSRGKGAPEPGGGG